MPRLKLFIEQGKVKGGYEALLSYNVSLTGVGDFALDYKKKVVAPLLFGTAKSQHNIYKIFNYKYVNS